MDIDWPTEFGRWLDRLEAEAGSGDVRSRAILVFVARALDQLWRVSHAYHPEVAVRLICWFPPEAGEAMTDNATPDQPAFERGNERLDELLSDPQIAADVAQAHADAEEMNRVYAMNLAMIRKAAQMTQVEVARRLGVGQGAVSRLENRGDMLLSTLHDYLMATGADAASIVVVVRGHKIELDLGQLHDDDRRSA